METLVNLFKDKKALLKNNPILLVTVKMVGITRKIRMKLYYITRVVMPSGVAQSVQIVAMCEAFAEKIENFKLISPLSESNQVISKDFSWEKIKLTTSFRYLEIVVKSMLIILKEKPTHIFTRDIVVAFVLSFLNLKVFYEAHKEPKTKVADIMLRVLRAKKNFLLITISRALKKFFISYYKYNSLKVFYYHDGVFIEKYDNLRGLSKHTLREEIGLPSDKIIIVHTGTLYKGNDAKLFEHVVKNFHNILFVQVGGMQKDIARFKVYYSDYRNIIFVEHQDSDNLIKYQMTADLLFYALTKENSLWWCTSPLKIFEYMATGIPILGSNIGSVGEVLTEKNCIVYNPNDEMSIIKGVKKFLEDKKSANKLARQALKDINNSYTWKLRVNKIIEFMENN